MNQLKVFVCLVLYSMINLNVEAYPGNINESGSIEKGKSFTIIGHISGVINKYIYLKPAYGPDYGATDSLFSKTGDFHFKGTFKEKQLMTLSVEGTRSGFAFVLEKGQITIQGDITDMNNARAVGAPENEIYAQYRKLSTDLNEQIQVIINKVKLAKINGDSTAYQIYNQEWNEMGTVYEKKMGEFIKLHPASFAALNICRNHTFGNPDMAKLFLSFLDKSLHQHTIYMEVKHRAEIEERIAIDKQAPDFTLFTLQGEKFVLNSLKGKYVLIDFWASWCVPCRKESENLVQVYKTFSPKGLEIVSVSLDDNKEHWLKAVERDGYSWINVSDLKGWKNKAALLYGVSTIPKNILLDKEGKIIAMNLIGEALNKKLMEIMH